MFLKNLENQCHILHNFEFHSSKYLICENMHNGRFNEMLICTAKDYCHDFCHGLKLLLIYAVGSLYLEFLSTSNEPHSFGLLHSLHRSRTSNILIPSTDKTN